MHFSSIIGQQAAKERFISSVKEQRIPHAQLICGNEGIGKLPLAIAYAQYICCENRTETDSCGTCPSCVKFAKLIHPDVHFVFPVANPSVKTGICDSVLGKFREHVLSNGYFSDQSWFDFSGAEGKKGIIYSSESDEIVKKLNKKSYEAEYKIMIIWQPEKMHTTCANKLLKLLEEPPAKTLFLLVSDAPDEIITTILSRAQRINIPPLLTEDIAKALQAEFSLEEADAINIARIANGNYIYAKEILQHNEDNALFLEFFMRFMRTAYGIKFFADKQKKADALIDLKKFSEEIAKIGREKQKAFLIYSQRLIRENFMYNLGEGDLNYLTYEESEFSAKFAKFVNESNIIGIMDEFALAEAHIEQNVSAKMVFFDLVLKMIMLFK